uniref:Uncharacterized protein n=1 Tax=Amphimedon queenslandica TaxID=400682 RepID=A0A1X7UDJ7_AMPQE
LDQNLTLKELSLRSHVTSVNTPISFSRHFKAKSERIQKYPDGAVFTPTTLAKQSRPGRNMNNFFFPRFIENERLCLVKSLTLY